MRHSCTQLRVKSPTHLTRDGGPQFDIASGYELSVDVEAQLAWVTDLEKRKVTSFPFSQVEHFVLADPAAIERAAKRSPGRPRKNELE